MNTDAKGSDLMKERMMQETFWNKLMYWDLMLLALAANVSTGISSVAVGLGILIVILQYLFLRKLPVMDKGIGKAFVLFFSIQIVIAALSIDPAVSFRTIFGELHRFFVLFFALMYLTDKKRIGNVLLAFVFSSLINDAEAIRQAVQTNFQNAHLVYGFNNAHTLFASQCLAGLPASMFAMVYPYEQRKKLKQYFAFFTTLCTIAAIIISGARGGWVALAVAAIAYILLSRVHVKAIIITSIILGVMGACAVVWLPWAHQYAASITDFKHRANTERFLMWQSAIDIIRDYPLHGIGQDRFALLYNAKYISPMARERAPEGQPEKGHGHPHNYILKITSEGGMLGLSAFLIFYGYLVYRLWIMYRQEYGKTLVPCGMAGLLLFVGILAEGMTDTNMNQVPIMRAYWLSMGVYFAAWECRKFE